ncbi:MAG: type II toxin-antitoxin system RelE/ParE family toxin [Gammaproteobacteria bacterium]|nr:type II toxin-antitoxin system RelE/ParE family toxin [Gammaproteobacteria bacterium]
MYTVIETLVYARKADRLLTDEDRETFAAFVSANPDAEAVVRGSGGVRKVRFAQVGRGKSGGVRVIYYNRLANGEVWLLTMYGKGERSTIPAHELKVIKEAIEHG